MSRVKQPAKRKTAAPPQGKTQPGKGKPAPKRVPKIGGGAGKRVKAVKEPVGTTAGTGSAHPSRGAVGSGRSVGLKHPAGPPAGPEESLLFGHHAVAEAWTNRNRVIHRLWATKSALAALKGSLEAAERQGLRRPVPEVVDRTVIDARLESHTVHQGLLALVSPLPTLDLADIPMALNEGKPTARRRCLVILDQVTDPHNVGAILRTAAAFGVTALIMTHRHAPAISGTLAKVASGAVEHVPIVRVTNLARSLAQLNDQGITTVGLAEEGQTPLARTVEGLGPDTPVALVLGAEGTGLRRLTRETCEILARLPTTGPIASLNVSNAAAAALYELVRTS